MKRLLLIGTTIVAIGGATTNQAGACDLKLPTFEVTGFPISAHQVAVLGSANVEQRSPRPTLKLAGMPASPHQIAVLTPRKKVQIVEGSMDLSSIGRDRPTLLRIAAGPSCAPD
jgi:hypothetical protein